MKNSKLLLNVTAFFCFVYFALYTFSLIFIPIGIYCFLAGKKFAYKAEHLDDPFKLSKKEFKNYVIFVSVFCFPFGLLAILPYKYLASNNISVSSVDENTTSYTVKSVDETESQPLSDEHIETVAETDVETTAEKLEKYEKLKNFKEKGLITEEELEQAREQLFGSKED